jgi:hypothetical protein
MHTVYQFALSVTIIAGLLLGGVLSPQAVTAATYYVATTGNDDNAGTQARPFRTIRKGLTTLRAGDTLYLRGGRYNEGIKNTSKQTIPSGNSWANPVTIAGYRGEDVTIQGGVSLRTYGGSLRYLVFDNLIMDGKGFYVRGPRAQHIRLQNSEVKNATQGIQGYDAAYIEFINLKVHNNGSSRLHHGFYIAIQHALIEGCDIYNNSGYGIHIYDSGCKTNDCADNTTIRNSSIHDNRGDGGVTLNHGSDILFSNNLVYDNRSGVTVSYGKPTNTKIEDNTIYNNSGYGIRINSVSIRAIVQDNILSQNGAAIRDHGAATLLRNNTIE